MSDVLPLSPTLDMFTESTHSGYLSLPSLVVGCSWIASDGVKDRSSAWKVMKMIFWYNVWPNRAHFPKDEMGVWHHDDVVHPAYWEMSWLEHFYVSIGISWTCFCESKCCLRATVNQQIFAVILISLISPVIGNRPKLMAGQIWNPLQILAVSV